MSMKFHKFSFPNKKAKSEFENAVNLDKGEVIKYARLLMAKCEEKGTQRLFLGEFALTSNL